MKREGQSSLSETKGNLYAKDSQDIKLDEQLLIVVKTKL